MSTTAELAQETTCRGIIARIIKPPRPHEYGYSVFLAGSMEMGTAENWQTRLETELSPLNIIIYNPRRDDWDASWEQKITNPQFRDQVQWELEALERANIIALYFDPATKSPISLLELGLFHAAGDGGRGLIVCCPDGFWRKGNVDIVCARYGILQVDSLDDLVVQVLLRATTALTARRRR